MLKYVQRYVTVTGIQNGQQRTIGHDRRKVIITSSVNLKMAVLINHRQGLRDHATAHRFGQVPWGNVLSDDNDPMRGGEICNFIALYMLLRHVGRPLSLNLHGAPAWCFCFVGCYNCSFYL